MITIDEFPGRQISLRGKEYLYFGGTSYLGLQTNKQFQNLFIENLKKYGTGYGASRHSNIQLSVFKEAEDYLSQKVGSESCITLSSGYLAGQLVCDYFSSGNYSLYYAPNTHSALYRSHQKVFDTWDTLITNLRTEVKINSSKTPVLFLDSIDFEGQNFPDFKQLRKLPLENIILVVDDSHGIGITGNKGGGSYQFLKSLKPKGILVSASLGKGFGIQAGAIFGDYPTIQVLKSTPFFGGASPAIPAALATLVQADSLYAEQKTILERNTKLFLEQSKNLSKFNFIPGHPSFGFQDENLSNTLEKAQILVTNFRYPTSTSPLMSRIIVSALHTKNDILKITNILNSSI